MVHESSSARSSKRAQLEYSAKPPRRAATHARSLTTGAAGDLSRAEFVGDALPLLTIVEGAAILWSALASSVLNDVLAGTDVLLAPFLGPGLAGAALYCGIMGYIDRANRSRPLKGWPAYRSVLAVWGAVAGTIMALVLGLKIGASQISGTMLSFYLVTGAASLVAVRSAAPRIARVNFRTLRADGELALLIGAFGHRDVSDVSNESLLQGRHRPKVVLVKGDCPEDAWPAEFQRTLDEVLHFARTHGPGTICIAASGIPGKRVEEIADALKAVPRTVQLVPGGTAQGLLARPVQSIGRIACVELQRAPQGAAGRFAKRVLDLCISIPVLVFIAPLLCAIALAIKLDSRGPVFYRQLRRGLHGTPFRILKFRTMVVEESGWSVRQATRNDDRVTKVGRWLRKTSLDELPQLFNVIEGDMSLVGPRPHAVFHDEYYARLVKNYEIRQHVVPGITGWAQVNGYRGETAALDLMTQRIEHDIWYVAHAGVMLDLWILARTAIEVLRSRNAY